MRNEKAFHPRLMRSYFAAPLSRRSVRGGSTPGGGRRSRASDLRSLQSRNEDTCAPSPRKTEQRR